MGTIKTVSIPLSNIENRFDVRTVLDQDRVLQFMTMYEDGTELPPIKVVALGDDKYAYLDGRHRGAALQYLDRKEASCIIRSSSLLDTPLELFAEALEANYGGAKPPTREDINHTFIRLLEAGCSQTAIRERFNFLPAGACRAYIASARSTVMKRKIAKALDSVTEGELSIADAARKYGIKEEALKDVLAGKKRKFISRSEEADFCIEVKGHITKALRSANGGISKRVETMLQKVEDGDISYKAAEDVIRAWRTHLKNTGVRVSDWQARLNAIAGVTEKSAEANV